MPCVGLFWAWHGVAWCSEGFVLLSRVLAWGSGCCRVACFMVHGWAVECAAGWDARAALLLGSLVGGLVVLWRLLACWPLGVWREVMFGGPGG